ncbi:hypothetical protein CS022_20230 [Veronia nyctiphanis]|uniref:Uncharacterized protein n=1 Tax=Veronia nyctiphanis TaxID=1278244 RepID=A0A4Q0YLK7_9GAMM|nr:hypothetical protein CS022_20230 [Veronia nyctiphanis]
MNDIESPEIKSLLTEAISVKSRQLPTRYWNAIGGSDAWNKQLGLPVNMISIKNVVPDSNVTSAINAFADIPNATTGQLTITPWQETIEKQKMLGALFFSLDESRRWLTATTQQLRENDKKILCGRNINQTKAKYLRNIFDEFYVDQIQPYLASLDNMYQDISPSLRQIAEYSDTPSAFNDYQTAYFEGKHYQLYKKAVKDHVIYWRELFERCNMRIGQ